MHVSTEGTVKIFPPKGWRRVTSHPSTSNSTTVLDGPQRTRIVLGLDVVDGEQRLSLTAQRAGKPLSDDAFAELMKLFFPAYTRSVRRLPANGTDSRALAYLNTLH